MKPVIMGTKSYEISKRVNPVRNGVSRRDISNGVNVYVGIGANIGNRQENIRKAIKLIGKIKGTKVTRSSSIYETEPVGKKNQPWFLNCVVELESHLPPQALLDTLLDIEKKLGRKRRIRWEPRLIDLDILFYGKRKIARENLIVPHPEIAKRKFVLLPLKEINPYFRHPILKKTAGQLLSKLKNNQDQVKKLNRRHRAFLSL